MEVTAELWKAVAKSLALLSSAGLVAAVIFHIYAWWNPNLPVERVLPVFFGVFVVALPTVLLYQQLIPRDRGADWRLMLREVPAWTRYIVYGSLAYPAALLAIPQLLGVFEVSGVSPTDAAYFTAMSLPPYAWGLATGVAFLTRADGAAKT